MKKITIITGHYGSGKTNICVNMALSLVPIDKKVSVIDLDTVNPYFRTADFKNLFSNHNIELISSVYANSNLDTPAITFGIESIIKDDGYLLIDVGGDDTGAFALGQFSNMLSHYFNDLDMFYVINTYRYMTKTPSDALKLMEDIELASRLKHTGIINNSNLANETTIEVVEKSRTFAEELSKMSGLPIVKTAYPYESINQVGCKDAFFVKRYVLPIWEK
ncbi:MAG: cobalamin biosynthesis protein CobQ [Oscillospiraceae bacterium]